MHTSRGHTNLVATNPGDARSVRVWRNGKRAALMAELQREEIVARIKQAREEVGMSQPEMGDALNVHWRTVQNYETVRVPFALLGRIAEVTGKTTEWLLHGETPNLLGALNGGGKELQKQVARIEAKLDWLIRQAGADPAEAVGSVIAAAEAAASDPRQPRSSAAKGRARKDPPAAA